MDTFAAVALATETPHPELLKLRPFDRNEPLMTNYSLRRMIMQIVMQTATFLILLTVGDEIFGAPSACEEEIGDCSDAAIELWEKGGINGTEDNTLQSHSTEHLTVVFNCFVLSQLFNQFNSRKLYPKLNVFSRILRHRLFIGVWLFAFTVQILMITFGENAIKVKRLDILQWLGCIVVGVLPLVWTFLFNLLPKSYLTSAVYIPFLSKRDHAQEEELQLTPVHSEAESEEERKKREEEEAHRRRSQVAIRWQSAGRRIAARQRWQDLIVDVMTRIDVITAFRRHHR